METTYNSDTTAVSVRNLTVSSGKSEILKGISLDIPRNGITVLLGPSGCGKTTLLRSMNRLTDLDPSLKLSGQILIDDEDVLSQQGDITLIRQKMGLLLQKPQPLPMSIFENIAYGMRLKGIRDMAVLRRRVEKHLREVALWDEVKDRLNHSARMLSVGQQQRLCLARGLAINPEIILADEPTSALDPLSSRAIEELFKELKKDYTVVLVTHILRQAKRLADHVVFLYLGDVVEQGPAEQMFNNPQTERFKEYLTLGT